MFERFTKDARAVVEDAVDEANESGARRVEAEHLLLALGARGVAGLDREAVVEALATERRHSLAAVGIALDDLDVPAPASRPAKHRPAFGTSAKAALERSLRAAADRGDRRIGPPHILLGLLRSEHGRVRRALEMGAVSPHELSNRAHAAATAS